MFCHGLLSPLSQLSAWLCGFTSVFLLHFSFLFSAVCMCEGTHVSICLPRRCCFLKWFYFWVDCISMCPHYHSFKSWQDDSINMGHKSSTPQELASSCDSCSLPYGTGRVATLAECWFLFCAMAPPVPDLINIPGQAHILSLWQITSLICKAN